MNRPAPEPGVTGSVEKGNDFFELRDGEIGEVGAVNVIRGLVMRHETDQVLHAFDPLRCSFLYRRLIFHHPFGKSHQLHRHDLEKRKSFCYQRRAIWKSLKMSFDETL